MKNSDMPVLMANPLVYSIKKTWSLLMNLDYSPKSIVPSIIAFLVICITLLVQMILWFYGWLPVIADFLWGFVEHTVSQLKKAGSFVEKMPFTVACGIYVVMWLPFALACIPFYVIGWIGEKIANLGG